MILRSFCRLHKKGLSPPQTKLKMACGPAGIDPIAPGVHDPARFEARQVARCSGTAKQLSISQREKLL